jgi:HEPN domain-containing protein
MPPEADQAGSPEDWLRHAHSDLQLARLSPPSGVLLEGLCFHAQQAAEKALKAVLVAQNTPLPRTHSIGRLVELLPDGVSVPSEVQHATNLTDYAVTTRYLGVSEPVEEEEHREAVRLAEAVVAWAERMVRG